MIELPLHPVDHKLDTLPQHFKRVATGEKNFEIRKGDRDYQKGDKVMLEELSEASAGISINGVSAKTGRTIGATIGYVTAFGQVEGYVVFSLLNVCTHE